MEIPPIASSQCSYHRPLLPSTRSICRRRRAGSTPASNNSTLKPGDRLDVTGELCSEKGKYCMNFDPEYLRIFAQGQDDWVVWMANRDKPADIASATLSLNHSGVLKIESKNVTLIILYSPPQPVNNTVATLLATGNFVLEQLHPNGNKSMLWQSFDFPTDSLLPGMKLGVNHKTRRNWSLVSSFSKSLPAPGPFRLDWEPKTKELVTRRGKQVYWRSGELRNKRFKHISAEAEYHAMFNDDEEYFMFTTPSEELTKWTLLETGQLINRKGNDIARADKCYGYNTDEGCQKWEERPTCRARGDEFDYKSGYPNLNTARNVVNVRYGISDCQAMCWSNCSCIGFASFDNINGTGCTFYQSVEGTNIAGGGEDFYLLVKSTRHKGSKWWMWMCGAMATVLLIIFHSILCHTMTKQKYVRQEKANKIRTEMQDIEASRGSTSDNDLQLNISGGDDLELFSYASIMVATNGFSLDNKLGQGGFGPVFKGILPSGQEVAVKKLSKTSGQGAIEFKNELTLISKLQHTNLVQLLGHCIHQQERMLVYEYMSNKSLDCFLFDASGRELLDWSKRFSIIEGIGQGLLYLHKYSRLKIIHRDLKASNILLDENMNPKISDFGVARMFTKQETESNTNRIVGTYGYMSPEYAMEGVFSTKSDVYSFGVLLLEIVSGRRNNSLCSEERPLNLVGHAWELWKAGLVLQVVDPALNNSFSEDEVLRCVHVGLLCVEDNADDRPTMSSVILMLANKTKVNILPKKPAYYVRTSLLDEETFGVDSTYEKFGSELHTV
ncbi:G-type lectin S-receptor-like serine/threonine-protein kinase CES101 [Lotus japonicus]|uniref:G-type lectin S-receptor-like serine/threonine-protein kinase CES101 n=1 Tax=Lotus japonicus TaxID=34305 RepID=UPI002586E878|nr:G-type lectin S-receptor-like serine/threonine-protein kinase CES101 [Lotus japonicus]